MVHVLGNKFIRQSAGLTAILAAGSLLLLAFTSAPAAAHDPQRDSLPFELGLPLPDEPVCDVGGLFAVKFCDAVSEYERARVEIRSNQTLDLPIAGTYKIISKNGYTIEERDFCGETSVGLAPHAAEIIVDVASVSSLTNGALSGEQCGVSLTAGEVRLTLSHSSAATPAEEEEEECHDGHE